MGGLEGRWVAKLVAPDKVALWGVRIQTYLSVSKIQNGRHKQRSGQHTLARQKNLVSPVCRHSAMASFAF
jgi:hypothetical protein